MSATVPCPSCGTALSVPATWCPACGVSLAGPVAAELWQVESQLSALAARRSGLVEQLRRGSKLPDPGSVPAGPGAGPGSGTAVQFGAATGPVPAGAPVRPGVPRPASGEAPRWAAQQILLGVGALLILIAAAVFLAVSWDVVGVAGQVGIMGLLTVAAVAGSVALVRRSLRASAEAVAVLAVGLAVVDVAAAHELNLAGLGSVNGLRYGAAVATGLAVVFVLLSAPRLKLRLVAYRWAAIAAAAAAPLLAVLAEEPELVVTTAIFAVTATAFGAASRLLPGGWSIFRRPAAVVAGLYLVLTWLVGLVEVVDRGDLLGTAGVGAAIALATVAGAAVLAGLHRGPLPALGEHPLLAGGALLAVAVYLVALTARGEAVHLAVLTVLAVSIPAVLCGTRLALSHHPGGTAALAGQLVAAFALLALVVEADLSAPTPSWAALVVALVATSLAAVVILFRRPALRLPAAGLASAATAGAAGVAAAPYGDAPTGYALVAVALVAAVAAVGVRGSRLELLLGVTAGSVAALASGFAAVAGLRPLAVVLGLIGVTAYGYAIAPGRGRVALLGVASSSAAIWCLLYDAEVDVLEAYSLPLAALVGVMGLVRWRRQPGAPSWLTVGPSLSVALLPSALTTVGDPALLRPLLGVGFGAAVLVAGVAGRWQAPVVIGGVALTIVAVAQLAPYAVGLPRWLTFGTVGLVLLVLGFRYEQRRRNASQAVRWLGALQ